MQPMASKIAVDAIEFKTRCIPSDTPLLLEDSDGGKALLDKLVGGADARGTSPENNYMGQGSLARRLFIGRKV